MDEIQVRLSVIVRKGSQVYQSQPTSFTADMVGSFGPTPSALTASIDGTDVDLSKIQIPGGICWVTNLDAVNFVTYGIWDPVTSHFYPLGELLPGEINLIRLSRFLGEEYGVSGTGTIGSGATLRFKADTAPCNIKVEAFDA